MTECGFHVDDPGSNSAEELSRRVKVGSVSSVTGLLDQDGSDLRPLVFLGRRADDLFGRPSERFQSLLRGREIVTCECAVKREVRLIDSAESASELREGGLGLSVRFRLFW